MPSSEMFGLAAAVVILLLAFGSVVAMGLPIVTALFGISIGLSGVVLWSHVFITPGFTPQVASMVGIGVGIDYALFIVTRYRGSLARLGPRDSLVEAMSTSGPCGRVRRLHRDGLDARHAAHRAARSSTGSRSGCRARCSWPCWPR